MNSSRAFDKDLSGWELLNYLPVVVMIVDFVRFVWSFNCFEPICIIPGWNSSCNMIERGCIFFAEWIDGRISRFQSRRVSSGLKLGYDFMLNHWKYAVLFSRRDRYSNAINSFFDQCPCFFYTWLCGVDEWVQVCDLAVDEWGRLLNVPTLFDLNDCLSHFWFYTGFLENVVWGIHYDVGSPPS